MRAVTRTPPSSLTADWKLARVNDLMPCFLKDFASSALISSSSIGRSLGSSSRIVTSVPNLKNIEANSTPTAPAPSTISDFGICFSSRISSLVIICSPSMGRFGSERGTDPVAMTTFLVWTTWAEPSSPVTVIRPGPSICAAPLKT